jgi:hypothetical protein
MTCEQIEHGELAEQYILGRMSENERLAYEDHYFACATCFGQLRQLQRLEAELRRLPAEVPRKQTGWPVWGAIAAGLLLAVGVGWQLVKPERPAAAPVAKSVVAGPNLELLARLEPPVWRDNVVRGLPGAEDAAFRAAMKLYAAGDYKAAWDGLEPLAKLPAAAFYGGICELELGQTAEAAARLAGVIGLGDTPWLEQARFFRAKALLKAGDVAGASAELKSVVVLQGDLEAEARRLLAALEAARAK